MNLAEPSRTAFGVAMRRAAHQLLDRPLVLDDPLALRILGPAVSEKLTTREQRPGSRYLRAFVVARSRYAEDQLAAAVQRGTRQYVLLGAGLDTFAYRNPFEPAGLRVFEVDHPATQAWKRQRLQEADIAVPGSTTFVPVDFERQNLTKCLNQASLDPAEPAWIAWLGVVPYLTEAAFNETLSFVASLASGTGIVFDYAIERGSLGWIERMAFDRLATRVASVGEPFRLFIEPRRLRQQLEQSGFRSIEELGADEINARYFSNRADGLHVRGGLGRLISARL